MARKACLCGFNPLKDIGRFDDKILLIDGGKKLGGVIRTFDEGLLPFSSRLSDFNFELYKPFGQVVCDILYPENDI